MLASLVQLTIDVGLSSQVTMSEPNDDMTPRRMRLLVGIQQTIHSYIVKGVLGCLKRAEPGVRRTRVVMNISSRPCRLRLDSISNAGVCRSYRRVNVSTRRRFICDNEPPNDPLNTECTCRRAE